MTTIPNGHEEKCTQCGSKAVNVEWDERVNATHSLALFELEERIYHASRL